MTKNEEQRPPYRYGILQYGDGLGGSSTTITFVSQERAEEHRDDSGWTKGVRITVEDCGNAEPEPGTPARDQLAKLIYEGHPDSMYSWDELDSRDKIWPLRTAGAILAAGFSRATAPDETEGRMSLVELEDIAEWHALCADRLFIETELVVEIRAERDAALARIAELEEALTKECRDLARTTAHTAAAMGTMRLTMGEVMVKLGYEGLREKLSTAEARIAEAAKLHQCFVAPNGFRWCSGCSTDEYPEEWPCPTADALGLTAEQEGELC